MYGVWDKATLKTEIIVYYLVQVDEKITVIYNSLQLEEIMLEFKFTYSNLFCYVEIVIKRKLTLRHVNVH